MIDLGQLGRSVRGVVGCPPSALSPKVGEVPRQCLLCPQSPPMSGERPPGTEKLRFWGWQILTQMCIFIFHLINSVKIGLL